MFGKTSLSIICARVLFVIRLVETPASSSGDTAEVADGTDSSKRGSAAAAATASTGDGGPLSHGVATSGKRLPPAPGYVRRQSSYASMCGGRRAVLTGGAGETIDDSAVSQEVGTQHVVIYSESSLNLPTGTAACIEGNSRHQYGTHHTLTACMWCHKHFSICTSSTCRSLIHLLCVI